MAWDGEDRPVGPHLDEVRPGDVLIFDGKAKIVRSDGDGDLYVTCGRGKRWLADDADASGRLIGCEASE